MNVEAPVSWVAFSVLWLCFYGFCGGMSGLVEGAQKVANYRLAERRARELSKNYAAPPIPVLEIAELNGVDVEFTGFGEYGNQIAGFCDFQERKLYVNQDDNLGRQAFTIAHELGHWVLHRELFTRDPDLYRGLPRFQKVGKKDPREQEANCFAANLLVPANLLKPVIMASTSTLSEIFGVSREMMEYRVKDVGR